MLHEEKLGAGEVAMGAGSGVSVGVEREGYAWDPPVRVVKRNLGGKQCSQPSDREMDDWYQSKLQLGLWEVLGLSLILG